MYSENILLSNTLHDMNSIRLVWFDFTVYELFVG